MLTSFFYSFPKDGSYLRWLIMFVAWQRFTMCVHLLGRGPLCIIAIVVACLANPIAND